MYIPHQRTWQFGITYGSLLLVALILFVFRNRSLGPFIWSESGMNSLPNHYSVMTANVGNSDLGCFRYNWKLCRKDVETRLAANIQTIQPDIITLQEVLPPWLCEETAENDPDKVCFDAQEVPQARRLLGPDYSIVCDQRLQYECIAVHRRAGEIIGCPPGGYCSIARTVEVGLDCDSGFSISAVSIRLWDGKQLDVVNVHPPSFSDRCRVESLRAAFYGSSDAGPIIEQERVLVMGDFNMDPWRSRNDSKQTWEKIFTAGWAGRPFRYHSGSAEIDPPRYTLVFGIRRTLDLVLSNFADGVCQVLGESPGTSRLDGGRGNDHRAVYGVLNFAP